MSGHEVLNRLMPGDIIYGETSSGLPKIFIVTSIHDGILEVRHITTQTAAVFSMDNGQSTYVDGGGDCHIVSISPLDNHRHETLLGLERKMRLSINEADLKLTDDETRVLLEAEQLFRARSIAFQK